MIEKTTVVRYTFSGDKFEILVKPDPLGKYPLIFSAYIVGIEVLLRMTEANLFWEFGKYAVIYFLLLGMARKQIKIKIRGYKIYFKLFKNYIIY